MTLRPILAELRSLPPLGSLETPSAHATDGTTSNHTSAPAGSDNAKSEHPDSGTSTR